MRTSRRLVVTIALTGICGISGCAATGHVSASKSSPTQLGVGLRVNGPVASVGAATIVAVAGYEYSDWDGGHDDVISGGLQARVSAGDALIVGGEALYHRWICRSDEAAGCSDNPSANGLGLNALVMKPMAGDRVRLWVAGGPKWLTDFSTDEGFAFESGFGWHVFFGAELPFAGR